MHSTITALLPIVNNIAVGFNEKKPASRTAMVVLDISKAFDNINHDLLLQKISDTTLHSNVTRWMAAYLQGRTAECLFQGATSPQFTCHSGVPQGSVLSPMLFNFFVGDCPVVAQINLSYADDFNLTESSPDVPSIGRKLTKHPILISKWAKDNGLQIALEKSSVILFTPRQELSVSDTKD
jgi:retron-type reverse transcriptase